jgi:hypothetical protein
MFSRRHFAAAAVLALAFASYAHRRNSHTLHTAPAAQPSPVATEHLSTSEGVLRAIAEIRRVRAFDRVLEARQAERDQQYAEARNLYQLALTLDPHNPTAMDGHTRMRAILAEEPVRLPRLNRTEAMVSGSFHTYYDFTTAVDEADSALSAKPPRARDARAAWQRARDAANENPGIFPAEHIRIWADRLLELDRRVSEAEQRAPRTRFSRQFCRRWSCRVTDLCGHCLPPRFPLR